MKQVLVLLTIFIGTFSQAQMPTGMGAPGGRPGGGNMNIGRFYGRVIDAASNKGVDAASVQLIQNKFDAATKKRKDTLIAGMLTDRRGEFSFESLPVGATYKLVISAIGFKEIEQKVGFELNMAGGDMQKALAGGGTDGTALIIQEKGGVGQGIG